MPKPTRSAATLDFSSSLGTYVFVAIIYFVGFFIARRIVRSPFGAVLRAIRENPERALAVGHDVPRYKLVAFTIAAAYGGLAGGLLGMFQGYMPPEAFSIDQSGEIIVMTVIGGPGTLIGPLVGAGVWTLSAARAAEHRRDRRDLEADPGPDLRLADHRLPARARRRRDRAVAARCGRPR